MQIAVMRISVIRRGLSAAMAAGVLLLAGGCATVGAGAGGGQAVDRLAALAERGVTRVAFGSCSHQARPQPIWDAVLAVEPDLFIFAGDNVYGDVSSPELTEMRDAYAAFGEIEGFRRLRAEVPLLATWDDHDYAFDDADGTFAYKEASEAMFLDFWRVPADDPRRARPGIHYAKSFGPPGRRVQVILLDTRYFRSPLASVPDPARPGRRRYVPDGDPDKTMLGAAQWRWLAERLAEPAELRLIVSSIQVLVEGRGQEQWAQLPRERQRLFDLIGETGADGVILLSGDRHLGALYRLEEGVPYPLYELTSSSLNLPFRARPQAEVHSIGARYVRENFGMVAVDWEAGTVALELRGLDGRIERRIVVPLDEIRQPRA